MESRVQEAQRYVSRLDLPSLRLEGLEQATPSSDYLSAAKDQAVIVGSEITSFVKGVTPEQGQDIINSALLAQLVAKKRVPDAIDIRVVRSIF
jgi:hypothetical protein